jgi:hypothetical protein
MEVCGGTEHAAMPRNKWLAHRYWPFFSILFE